MKIWLAVLGGFLFLCIPSYAQNTRTQRVEYYTQCPGGNPPAGTIWTCQDGTGKLICVDSGGNNCLQATITPPGSDKFALFNDNGALGANTCFQFDKATGNLTVCGTITGLSLHTTGAGAGGITSAFGQALPTPLAAQNGLFFDPVTGNVTCYLNGGSFSTANCGTAGLVANPTVSQSVIQPSAGGAGPGTSFNSNVIEQVRYADGFAWSQSPAGTVSVGANTITINGVRGISQYSFSPGVNNSGSFSFATHMLRVAGTGTPEVVTITASTCTGSTSGTCTVTFTAANSHSAGYTIGTATAGFQEAFIDCMVTSVSNPTSGCTVKGSPFSNNHNIVFYGTLNIDSVIAQAGGNLHLDCEGALLEDSVVGAAMILIGGNHGAPNTWPPQTKIDNCHFGMASGVGRAATGAQIFILDKAQGLTVSHNEWDSNNQSPTCTDCVDGLVQVSGDQKFVFDDNVINAPAMKCDSTYCGWMVYGDGTNSSAIGVISNNYMNGADGFNWISGNGLTLSGNVFQNWFRYPWRYQTGLTSVTNLGGNYYEGASSTINPDFGVLGFSQNTGPQVMVSGTVVEYRAGVDRGQSGLGVHSFSSTGASVYSYYVVGNDGSGHFTRPLFIGVASSNGVTAVALKWLKFNATTYDILRTGPAVGDGTDAAPWGTSNWAVTTGLSCSVNPCTASDTFAALSSYSISSEAQGSSYCPTITYWPVPLFLSCGSTLTPSVYIGPFVNGFVNSSAPGTYAHYYDAVITSTAGGIGAITGMHFLQQAPLQGGASGGGTGALILNPDQQTIGSSGHTGRVNVPSMSWTNTTNFHNNLVFQTYDAQPNQTFATMNHQRILVAGDSGIGYDTDQRQMAVSCGAFHCNFYVNHIPDSGTSSKLSLTSTALDMPTTSCFSNGGTCAVLNPLKTAGIGYCYLPTMCASPVSATGAVVSGVANRVTVNQVVLPFGVAVNKIVVNVSALQAATTLNIAIYDKTGASKLADASFSCAATGVVSTTLGATVTLPPDTYLYAWASTGTTCALSSLNTGSAFQNLMNQNANRLYTTTSALSGITMPSSVTTGISVTNANTPVAFLEN